MGAAGGQRGRGQGAAPPHVADPVAAAPVGRAADRADAARAGRGARRRRVRRLSTAVLQRRARVLALRPLVRQAVLVGPARLPVLSDRLGEAVESFDRFSYLLASERSQRSPKSTVAVQTDRCWPWPAGRRSQTCCAIPGPSP